MKNKKVRYFLGILVCAWLLTACQSEEQTQQENSPYFIALIDDAPLPELWYLNLEQEIVDKVILNPDNQVNPSNDDEFSAWGPFLSGNGRYITVSDQYTHGYSRSQGVFIMDRQSKKVTYNPNCTFQWLINPEHYYCLFRVELEQPLADIPTRQKKIGLSFNLYLYQSGQHKFITHNDQFDNSIEYINNEGLVVRDYEKITLYDFNGKIVFTTRFTGYYVRKYLSKDTGIVLQDHNNDNIYLYDIATDQYTRVSELDNAVQYYGFNNETQELYYAVSGLTWKLVETKTLYKYNFNTGKVTKLSPSYFAYSPRVLIY